MKPKKEINTFDYDVSEDAPEFFVMEMQEDILWSDF